MDPSPSAASPSPSEDPRDELQRFLDDLIEDRNAVCTENALNVDNKHCIGCMLVMKYMQEHHPNMVYGTIEQWAVEAAFCARHEREIMANFIKSRRGNAPPG